MDRVAKKPLNDEAVDRASDEFYARHPELIENGKRIPLDPCDPDQAGLRSEWMDLYVEKGGEYYYGKFTPSCDDPVLPCCDSGVLMVQVVNEGGNPIGGALLEILGGESGMTFPNGWREFQDLPAPAPYNLRISKEGFEPAWASKAVVACDITILVVQLKTAEPEKPDEPKDDGCGSHSNACLRAQEEDPEIMALVERVEELIDDARTLSFDRAAAALEHYMDGSGTFVGIPMEYAEKVERECWAGHRDKLLDRIRDGSATKERIALHLVGEIPEEDPENATVKAEADWPWELTLEFDFTSGRAFESFWSDDALTYFGSALRSEVQVRCRRYDPDLRNYLCGIEEWRIWAVDNYDWEGMKGGKFGFPSQQEMNRLQEVRCARPYQRSSRSWKVKYWSKGTPNYVGPWIVEFGDDQDIQVAAAHRWAKEKVEKKWRGRERREGALPYPPPAEEM